MKKVGYVMHEISEKNYCLCRIIKEYDDIESCQDDLVYLLSGKTTEKKLMKGNKTFWERIGFGGKC